MTESFESFDDVLREAEALIDEGEPQSADPEATRSEDAGSSQPEDPGSSQSEGRKRRKKKISYL